MHEKIIDKVKKCLALAKSSGANEAATAMRQAQASMEKHGINQERVDLSAVQEVIANAGKAKNPKRYHQLLTSMSCDAFGVEAIYQAEAFFQAQTRIRSFGIGAQPEIAAYAYDVLYRQLITDRTAYIKTLKRYRRANKIRKADLFAESRVHAIWIKVESFAKTEEQMALIRRYKETRHQNLVKTKQRKYQFRIGDYDAALAGIQAGKNIHLHHGVSGEQDPARIGRKA